MKTISFIEANKDFKAILDTVCNSNDVITVACSNAEDAVIMSLAYYSSLMETLYLLKSPANADNLAKSIEQYKAGEVSLGLQ